MWILTALSAFLHFWRLFTPHAVVFDETYYEQFAGYYRMGEYFFDVHPPLGRLIFSAIGRVVGAAPSSLSAPISIPELRVAPALFGTLLVPLVFVLLFQLRAGRRVATLGAIAILLDNALLVQSRLILPDIFIIVFGVAAISCYLAARTHAGAGRWCRIGLSALLAGCALSVKWTGASALGVVLSMWLYDAARSFGERARRLGEAALIVVVGAIVYVGSWAVHFHLLNRSGPGDAFMSARFTRQLPGSRQFDPDAPKMTFAEKFMDVHHAIRYANGSLERVRHPASSPWYTWPVMKHPIPLWDGAHPATGDRAMIILLGNPVVWWGALIGAGLGAALFFARRRKWSGLHFSFSLLVGAALLNYVPFMAIRRVMYLYHYLFALTILVVFAALSVGVSAGWTADEDSWRFASRRSSALYLTLVAAMLVGFLYFLPLTYGFTLSGAAFDQRFAVLHPF
jgi:dolichyl-phosphate-mannose-protein mannosyltransferase